MSNEGNIGTSNLAETVDGPTRQRAASLSAHGLSDRQIVDALLLSDEQMEAIKETEEYKRKYHDEADQIIQAQIDRDEGWDAVETKGLEILLETMKFNRDPKFALMAAKMANSAERRTRQKVKDQQRVIDATITPTGEVKSNIIILNINKNYAQREGNMIEVSARPAQIPLKQSDIPSPKLVDQLLVGENELNKISNNKQETIDDLKKMFDAAGVVFDHDD